MMCLHSIGAPCIGVSSSCSHAVVPSCSGASSLSSCPSMVTASCSSASCTRSPPVGLSHGTVLSAPHAPPITPSSSAVLCLCPAFCPQCLGFCDCGSLSHANEFNTGSVLTFLKPITVKQQYHPAL